VAGSWGVASADHEPVVVLITDFDNQTNDPAFDHTLEPMLRMALEGAGFISAYDRTRIRSAFGLSPPERLEPATGRQLALKQGLGIVIDGSISRADQAYAIDLQVSQPITGNVALRDRQRANGKDDVMQTVTQLAAKVRRVLGERMTESDQLFAMRTISATSFDVISNYAAGIELQSRGRYEEARQRFLKSVELDPDFALGFQSLSVNSRNTGNLNAAEKYARVAIEHLDGVTERERLSIKGNYYWATGDLRQCVTEYAALIARYAGDTVARNQRALCLGKLGDMHGAMEELRRALSILPNHVTYRTNLAMFAAYAGEFDVAEQMVRSINEPSAPALQALPLSLLGQGRTAEAVEAYQRLSEMGVWGQSFATAGLGDVALYEGRFADAAQMFERGVAADLDARRFDAAALKLVALANVEMSRARVTEATAAAERALTHSKALPVRFLAARILAQGGEFDASREVGSDLEAQVAVQPQAYAKIIEASVALKQGQSNAAIKLLTDANGMVDTWIGHFDLGRAYLEAGALPQADSEFDRCLKRRGEALSIVDEDPTYGYFPPVWGPPARSWRAPVPLIRQCALSVVRSSSRRRTAPPLLPAPGDAGLSDQTTGWLAGARDSVVGKSLALLHSRPSRGAGAEAETLRLRLVESFDARQLEGERVGERAILIALLRQPHRVAFQPVRVGDEHSRAHHRRVLRGDRAHRDQIAGSHLVAPRFADEWPPHGPQLVGAGLRHVRQDRARSIGLDFDAAVVPGRDDGQVRPLGESNRAGPGARDVRLHHAPHALNRLRLQLRCGPWAGEQSHGQCHRQQSLHNSLLEE
jgi:tetratricopeptide (TPR) repeat protein